MEYYERNIEKLFERKLRSSGVVLLVGPKFCGKTTTAMRFAQSFIRLNTRQTIKLANMEPRNTLLGSQPRLIDEWQMAPDIWNEAKNWIDENPTFGQFILTGCATPADKTKLYHSGAGRITTLKMRPMSLYESRDSKGCVSLNDLFNTPTIPVFDENTEFQLSDTAFLLCRGGWPLSLQKERNVALDVTTNYYDGIFNFDTGENNTFRNKKPDILRMILRSYARNISTQASYQTIIQDVIASNNRSTLDIKTFDEYLDTLRDLFIIEDVTAWNPNIRSKTTIRSTPTRHFVDPSIACQTLGIAPTDLMNDLNTFGLFFEDMAIRDLRVYAMNLDGDVFHYRDSNGRECDAVIHLKDGRWALIEIKLGGEKLIEEGAASLNKLRTIFNTEKHAFSMILTATGPAYRRKDGIYVVPLNCLKE